MQHQNQLPPHKSDSFIVSDDGLLFSNISSYSPILDLVKFSIACGRQGMDIAQRYYGPFSLHKILQEVKSNPKLLEPNAFTMTLKQIRTYTGLNFTLILRLQIATSQLHRCTISLRVKKLFASTRRNRLFSKLYVHSTEVIDCHIALKDLKFKEIHNWSGIEFASNNSVFKVLDTCIVESSDNKKQKVFQAQKNVNQITTLEELDRVSEQEIVRLQSRKKDHLRNICTIQALIDQQPTQLQEAKQTRYLTDQVRYYEKLNVQIHLKQAQYAKRREEIIVETQNQQ